MDVLLRVLLACMVLTSFYTHTIDLSSENLIISRMTFSDGFGILAIIVYTTSRIVDRSLLVRPPKLYILSFLVVCCFFSTIFTSLNMKSTLFEILILGYLVSLSFVVYEVFREDIQSFFQIILGTSFVMSFVGLYDLFAVNNQLPTFLDYVPMDHAVSGFRYFAQTGNFSFTMLSILLPFRYFKFFKLNDKVNLFFNMTLLLTILLMVASGAISIIISFILTASCIVLMNIKDKKILKDLSILGAVFVVFVTTLYFYATELFTNIVYRVNSRVLDRKNDTPEASFIVDNFFDSIKAFKDNMLFGSGLGGFVNNYSEFEIHGTYLKVIGETGIVGLIAYLVFFYFFIKLILQLDKDYLKYFIPFLVGSVVSWSYNYHFRKKEFWLLFSFLMILNYTLIKVRAKSNG